MVLVELKVQYNKLIDREKKAQQFFEAAPSEAVDKWLTKYNQLVRQLSSLIILYEKLTGKEMSESEVFDGFYDENMSPEALLVTKEAKQ